ncbi:MAG TPA: carboxypeptidase-like regulatory domain-containing protein, partial [Bryobacteraceae bacterium]|nr:carboxypeptidase-like regulatory domain-containing protein [Bryobacteraceae bacterium]
MRTFTLLCVALFCAALSWSQQSTARLLGVVTDPSGANIAAARIGVTNVATSQSWNVQTGEDGEYSVARLPIGEYTMLVEASGFASRSMKGIVLQVDQDARIDVVMSLGSTNETITVDASAPLLVTDTSSVGQVIENKAIVSMPLNGRAFWQLAQLTPGVVFTPGGSDISSGGQG